MKNSNTLKKIKQIAALSVVILWGILILTTVIISFIDSEVTNTLFKGLIFTDIVLPVVAYAMLFVYKIFKGRGV